MKITLKAARVNAGIRQHEAAEQLGISAETLRRYEKAIAFPDVPLIKKIERLYNVSYNDLIFLPKSNG